MTDVTDANDLSSRNLTLTLLLSEVSLSLTQLVAIDFLKPRTIGF
jgi:hypothetical protein